MSERVEIEECPFEPTGTYVPTPIRPLSREEGEWMYPHTHDIKIKHDATGRTRRCSCLTRKGRPCPIGADRNRGGVDYCHVHDPEGTYQQQQRK